MNLIPPPVEYSPEDLLAMPDGDQFELVDGRLVERHMGILADWVSGRLFARLSVFCDAHPLGWVFPGGDGGFQGFPNSLYFPREANTQAARSSRRLRRL